MLIFEIMIVVAFVWLFLCVVSATIASGKGRSGFGFFLLSFFLTPIVGLIGALIISPDAKELEYEALASGKLRACPQCAELILPEAVKCKHCGSAITPLPRPEPSLIDKIFLGK